MIRRVKRVFERPVPVTTPPGVSKVIEAPAARASGPGTSDPGSGNSPLAMEAPGARPNSAVGRWPLAPTDRPLRGLRLRTALVFLGAARLLRGEALRVARPRRSRLRRRFFSAEDSRANARLPAATLAGDLTFFPVDAEAVATASATAEI